MHVINVEMQHKITFVKVHKIYKSVARKSILLNQYRTIKFTNVKFQRNYNFVSFDT